MFNRFLPQMIRDQVRLILPTYPQSRKGESPLFCPQKGFLSGVQSSAPGNGIMGGNRTLTAFILETNSSREFPVIRINPDQEEEPARSGWDISLSRPVNDAVDAGANGT